ncbi:2-keto-4-pentenoate hydratase [Falsirhodobacter xinxiangensis]|uniref:2-keto-4-pentenoate hydratase n=1 Tax=Falsirhodobacter xinxiangensis TaxID=2530049 RepID=UPI0010AB2899|nr:2-keto-4-pentenoate hydratase [Rhodobacter xinxiangensis]
MSDIAIQAAELLRRAETGDKLDRLPDGLVPTDEAQAYAIQDAVLGDLPVAAWKVAAIRAPGPLQTSPLSDDMVIEGSLPPHLRAPEIEVEIAIRIDTDLPPREGDYDEAEVLAALGPAYAAIEVIESRFVSRKEAEKVSVLADRASSGGVVIGSGVSDWLDLDFTALNVSLVGDGPIATASGNATVQQTVQALVWLANHASRRGIGLRAGQFVITGSRIGPMPVAPGQRLVAAIERIGEVTLAV